MCDLLAICFSKPVTASFSLTGFRARSEHNWDGWGVAWYPDRAVQVIKEPVSAGESRLFSALLGDVEVRSEIFIAHVRRASNPRLAPPSYRNTHPFWRELNGKAYVFAHNGSLKPGVGSLDFKARFPLGRFRPVGGTGSEYVFCHMLACIEENVEEWGADEFRWLSEKLAEVNEYFTFNCAMSDGEHLFIYHDSGGHNGMAFTFRRAPFPTIRLRDMDEEVVLQEVKEDGLQGFVVTTLSKQYVGRPVYLTNEKWTPVKPGELMVIKKGRLIYSNRGRTV